MSNSKFMGKKIIIAIIAVLPFSSYAAVTTITRNASSFTPSSVTITVGDQIKFVNTSGVSIQPSSNPHPDHTNYTALNMSVIANNSSSTTGVLNNVGTWGYHDHLDDGVTGTIVIQAASSSPSSTPAATGGYTPVIPPPSVTIFNVDNVATSAAVISWRTDYYSYTWLKYGTSSGVYSDEFLTDLTQSRYEHSAGLANLIPDTKYYFIFATGRPWLYSEVVTSTEKTFQTLAMPKIEIKQPEAIVQKPAENNKIENKEQPIEDRKLIIENKAAKNSFSLEARQKINYIQSELLKILKQVLEILEKIQALPR